jgi:transcriptional regulator with XRE-family HTH domain
MQGLRARPIDAARQFTREQLTRFAMEVRIARASSGISQQALARRSGVSQGFVSMVERGRRTPGLEVANRLATACGLQIWLRLFPAHGVTLRDSGQLTMATAIVNAAHPHYRCRMEVPIGIPGDRRAHDLVMELPVETLALELERGFADLQAQVRAAQLKREVLAAHTNRPVRLVIALPETGAIRRMLRERAALLASTFPVPSRAIWRSIRTGRPIGGDGILLVPNERPRARIITPGIAFDGNSSRGPAQRSNRLPGVMERNQKGPPAAETRETHNPG